jgi:alanyl-tRNA synthetase
MNARELKQLFVDFFVSKNHVEIPSASLVPENDPTTLFISAGMHPLVPYLLGTPHPLGKRLVDVQKCVRTTDIDEVGDTCHHTFLEMLGNWSLGDYFKKEAIEFSYEFLIKHLHLDLKNIVVTCFAGNKNSSKDEFSASVWEKCGIPSKNIKYLADNWWGPAGTTGPCGPDSEMFFNGLEIWNDVFMEYNKNLDGTFTKLSQQNVDTGMGVERTIAVLNGFDDNYLSDIWQPIIREIEKLSEMEYGDKTDIDYIKDGKQCWVDVRRSMRIIADHIRSAVFIIADGVEPSNKEAGYVLRRLIRRSIRQGKLIGIEQNFCSIIAKSVLDNQPNYAGVYPELNQNKEKILETIETEENKFRKTLERGLHEIQKIIEKNKTVTGDDAFKLFESFGFPREMTLEEIEKSNIKVDRLDFEARYAYSQLEHQKQSQTLSAGKFKSGLADHSEIITKYHTATHLLHAALRKVLGDHVQQSGSNITSERLRFDFSQDQKLSDEQLKQVADLVNDQIRKKMAVTKETMLFVDAQKQGALAFFGTKYPETVSVYTIADFSKEVCTGPHVDNTGVLGTFKILKEESAGSGRRRIYAVLA